MASTDTKNFLDLKDEDGQTVFVAKWQVAAIVGDKDGCTIHMQNGSTFDVKQSARTVRNALEPTSSPVGDSTSNTAGEKTPVEG